MVLSRAAFRFAVAVGTLCGWAMAAPCLPAQSDAPPVEAAAGNATPADGAEPQPESGLPEIPTDASGFFELRPRSHAEEERLEAMSLFGSARLRAMKKDYVGALRLYERAHRLDPKSLIVLQEIVPLAFQLNRNDEGIRYALKSAELDPDNAVLLQRLAMYLSSEKKDFVRALRFYEQATQIPGSTAQDNLVILMEMGRLYYLTQDYAKSAEVLSKVQAALAAQTPEQLPEQARKVLLDSPEVTYTLFAEAFLEAGRLEEAKAAFQKAQEAKPNDALQGYNLARVLEKEGQLDAALVQLETYFRAKGTVRGQEPYRVLLRILDAQGERHTALSKLARMAALDADNAFLGYFLAEQYFRAADYAKAAPLYRRMLEQSPAVEAFRGLLRMYHENKDIPGLVATLAALNKSGRDTDPLAAEWKLLTQDKAIAAAVIQAATVRLGSPDQALTFDEALGVGLFGLDAGLFTECQPLLDEAAQRFPDDRNDLYLTWGLRLLRHEQFSLAVAVLKRGLDENVAPEGNPAYHYYLAGSLEMLGQTEEALAMAKEASAKAANLPRVLERGPWILFHAKRYDESKAAYQALIERLQSSSNDSLDVREVIKDCRLVLSHLCVLTGDPQAAEEWLEQVLDEFPDDTGALNDLGYLWADANRNLARAHEMIQQAVAADPDNSSYRDSLGWVLFRLGRLEEALKELEIAAKTKMDGVVADHLAEVLWALGRKQDALSRWQTALDSFQEQGDTTKADEIQTKITARGSE